MSSSLFWRPPEPEGKTLSDALKFALRDYFEGGGLHEWQTLGPRDVGFLRGLIAGSGVKSDLARDAAFLISQIERYGHVEVAERY